MAKKILLRAGTDAQRLAMTPTSRELVYTTDTKKVYIGDGSTAGGILVGPQSAGTTETNPFQDGTDDAGGQITAAGNTTITLAATDLFKSVKITVAGGAGIYTATITLATTNATEGDLVLLTLVIPASTNPTIEVRNATSGGTLLHSLHNDDAVAVLLWSGKFTYTGAAWIFTAGQYHNA